MGNMSDNFFAYPACAVGIIQTIFISLTPFPGNTRLNENIIQGLPRGRIVSFLEVYK